MSEREEVISEIKILEKEFIKVEHNLNERYEEIVHVLFRHIGRTECEDLMFDYDLTFTDKKCYQYYDYPQIISLDSNKEIYITGTRKNKVYFYDLPVNEKKLIADDIIKYLNNDNDE